MIREPIRLKWCTHCERELPVTDFYRSSCGGPQNRCKACHRWEARVSFRRRYRDSAFRRKVRASALRRYHTNAAYRERRIAVATACTRRRRAERKAAA